MLPDNMNEVIASYHCCMHGDGFLDRFYELFLASSNEVRIKFRDTDFVHQKLMLRESLLMMIMFDQNPAEVQDEMEQLARRHDRKNVDISPKLYESWMESLCAAIREHDPEFTPDIERQWRTAMKPGIDLMISLY